MVGDLILCRYGLLELYLAMKSAGWLKTSSEISSSKLEISGLDKYGQALFRKRVMYQYWVNSIDYLSEKLFFGYGLSTLRLALERWDSELSTRKYVDVYYDPENPDLSVLELGIHLEIFLAIGFGSAIIGIVATYLILGGIR